MRKIVKLTRKISDAISGEIFDSVATRVYLATDGSTLKLAPEAVFRPRRASDVTKVVSVLAERAATGEVIGLTARGKGTDRSGGALGDGVMMVLPAHMNKLVKLEKNEVPVRPGMLYSS